MYVFKKVMRSTLKITFFFILKIKICYFFFSKSNLFFGFNTNELLVSAKCKTNILEVIINIKKNVFNNTFFDYIFSLFFGQGQYILYS